MNNITFASSANFPPWAIVLILLAFFGLIVLAVILVKKKVKPLQIKKDDIPEEQAVQEELDRVLVPVDEETQKQMDEAAKREAEDDK